MQFEDFYAYDQLTAFLRAAEGAAGDLMRLRSLVQTPGGSRLMDYVQLGRSGCRSRNVRRQSA
ncbi:MAG: hypothetical protein ACOCX2_00835 [Armatimonadota bacterium]